MRLRNVANADEILNENKDICIPQCQDYKGRWHELFNNNNPIHIEVGMGKGQFIMGMAKNNPDINYIGIEVVKGVLIRAVQKLRENPQQNVILVCVDAMNLRDVFEKGEVERIYLNFSDPWPKNRHEKRRLTYKTFLEIFREIEITNGEIHFKTDNEKLFEYSIISMSQFGMVINFISLDLHKSDFPQNVMTEYEERFVNLGQRIYRLEAQFK